MKEFTTKKFEEMSNAKKFEVLDEEIAQDVSLFEVGTEKRKEMIRELILTDSPLCDVALMYVYATKKQRKTINKTMKALCGLSMVDILAILNDGNENRRELKSW